MKKHHTNRFYKGINSDTSFLERANDVLCDALNVRITSKDKDGMFAANIKGNREEFRLSEGFLPLGAVEYNGILFILSANPSQKGLGEIGTFPSPRGDSEGFDRVYRPLQNFVLTNPNELIQRVCDGNIDALNRVDFRSISLNFSCEHQARVIARIDFDKSVNLYWTDNFNPIRSINTGFHSETGLYNDRLYSEQQVSQGYINVINENNFTPIVKVDRLEKVGNLKAGHYFFFARYTDLSFNTTSFLGMSQAVPVFNELNTQSGNNIAYGLAPGDETNRNVILDVSNLDRESAFLEIGYIYYFGQDEFEVKLIDKRNIIGGNTSLQINITGNEPTIPLSLDEFIAYKPSDALFAKDLLQLSNRMYIANTRGRQIDHPDLRRFFCSIEIGEDNSLSRNVPFVSDTASNEHIYGVDVKDVHDRVGYFSGETYVFAGIPIFKGGFVGAAYPLTGYDNYTGTKVNPNQEGIFRFSNAKVNNFFKNNQAFIKGVAFDTTAAKAVFNGSQWLKENLIGIYFSRGERIPNLVYQGILVGNYKGESLFKKPEEDFENNRIAGPAASIYEAKQSFIWTPLLEPAVPYWMQTRPKPQQIFQFPPAFVIPGIQVPRYRYYPNGELYGEAADEYSVFSFDLYMDRALDLDKTPQSSFIERIGVIQDGMWDNSLPNRRAPVLPGTFFIDDIAYPSGFSNGELQYTRGNYPTEFVQLDIDYNVSGGFTSETFTVPLWSFNGQRFNSVNFVSRTREGDPINQGLFYKEYDRGQTEEDEFLMSLPIAAPDFILLTNNSEKDIAVANWRNHIVNVHKKDPSLLQYELSYDFKNTVFSPITDLIRVKDLLDTEVAYGGDCFVARTYLKIHNQHDTEAAENFYKVINSSTATPDNENYSGLYTQNNFGYIISIVTENAYNPNYRYEKGENSFYPKDFGFALTKNFPESNFYNTGYKRMLGPRQFLGIDLFKPISDNQFPTRIRPSLVHILNSLRDGYLQFTAGDFKDFDFQYGPINAIIARADDFFSFQDDAINLHPINERAMSPSGSTDTPFILGESKELTEFKRSLTIEYGTQHQWSVIRGEFGIYGFDWNKRTFWRVGQNGFENLGLMRQCEKWIEDIVKKKSSGYSDITEQLPDNPVCNLGIHSIYDREYKEVNMTFILGEGINETICFSEKLNNFMTKWSFTPVFYAELENDLYSFSDGSFWLHDALDEYDVFYNQLHPAYVEIVVNPDSELAKHFDNLIVSSNNVEFEKVTYETQHQSAEQDPFLGEFWNRAIYREFQWKLPIRRADNIVDSELSLGLVQSRMRGRYLIINLQYFQNKRMWLREIITAYTISKA